MLHFPPVETGQVTQRKDSLSVGSAYFWSAHSSAFRRQFVCNYLLSGLRQRKFVLSRLGESQFSVLINVNQHLSEWGSSFLQFLCVLKGEDICSFTLKCGWGVSSSR